jgi:hypothetical protein
MLAGASMQAIGCFGTSSQALSSAPSRDRSQCGLGPMDAKPCALTWNESNPRGRLSCVAQSSQKKPRGPGKRFKPGASGNPGGLPKWVREMRDLAGSHAPAAIARLAQLMRSRKHPELALRAAEALLDRAGLKPFCLEPEKVDVNLHDAGDPIARLGALLARRLATLGAPAAPAGVPSKSEPPGG